MKKILSLFIIVSVIIGSVSACGKAQNTQNSNTTISYTGTLPPGIEISESLYPGAITYTSDNRSDIENAIRIDRFNSIQINMIIGDKYMERDGKIYTVTCIGVATGHPVYVSNDKLLLTLTVLGGETKRIGQAAFQGSQTLSNVSLGEGVETIGDYAFYLCPKLAVLSLPETLTEIGAAAFSQSGLTEVIIPSSVTSIGKLAFANCNDLKKVTLPSRFNNEELLKSIFVDYSNITLVFTD